MIMAEQTAAESAKDVGSSVVADFGRMIPLSSILVETYPRPETIQENISRLAVEFPDWDFWWSPCSGGNYWAGRVGKKGRIKQRTPDAVAEQIAKESPISSSSQGQEVS